MRIPSSRLVWTTWERWVCPEETISSCTSELKLLKIKSRTSSPELQRLNCHERWIPSLARCLLLKKGHQMAKNGILCVWMGTSRKWGDTEPLNFDEASLSVEASTPHPVASTSYLHLRWLHLIAWGNSNGFLWFSSGPTPPPFFASSRKTRLKSQQVPKAEEQRVTHEDLLHSRRITWVFKTYRQKSGEYVWKWILRLWDSRGGNIKPYQA